MARHLPDRWCSSPFAAIVRKRKTARSTVPSQAAVPTWARDRPIVGVLPPCACAPTPPCAARPPPCTVRLDMTPHSGRLPTAREAGGPRAGRRAIDTTLILSGGRRSLCQINMEPLGAISHCAAISSAWFSSFGHHGIRRNSCGDIIKYIPFLSGR